MKRKMIHGFLTLIALSGILLTLWLGFGFFTPYNAWTAKRDLKNGIVQIIAVGLPVDPKIRNDLAKSYWFYYNYVGCNASIELINGSEQYNAQVKHYLNKKHGNNFLKRFNKQFGENAAKYRIQLRLDKVIKVVEQEHLFQMKFKLVDSLSKAKRSLSIIPTLQDSAKSIYLVKVGEDNGFNFVSYFNFLVDANTMKVLNPSGEIE